MQEMRPTRTLLCRGAGRLVATISVVLPCLLCLGPSTSCKRKEFPPLPAASVDIPGTPAPTASPPSTVPSENPSVETPEGYEPAQVFRVVLTTHGSAVLLRSDNDGRILPIFVGGTEALSIDLRNESRRFQRPLTHDLLDDLVDKLGGRLVKVHVDSLRSNVFVGRVYIQQADRTFDVDARPSDAIALALGNRIPIFVATKVFEAAGMRFEDLSLEGDELPNPPTGRPRDPMQL